MANIALTSECNRRCGYCFAQGVFEGAGGEPAWMSPEVFETALDFLTRSRIDEVRLLGGEPTLHPEFPRYVDMVMRRGQRLLVFTGGLVPERAMDCLEALPPDRGTVLVNAIAPGRHASASTIRKQEELFGRLGGRVMLGLTIDTPGAELPFLLELIDRFGLQRRVRLGLAHPIVGGENDYLRPRHYQEVGRRITAFGRAAAERSVQLDLDCGFVPCMFPDGALRALGKRPDEVGRRCNPILDIRPDGRVVDCCALARLTGAMPMPVERDASWLRMQFSARRRPDRELMLKKECAECRWRTSGECSGGCLASAVRRWRRRDSFKVVLDSHTRRLRKVAGPNGSAPPSDGTLAGRRVTRLHQRLPIFHLEEGGRRVIYTPGRSYRVVSRSEVADDASAVGSAGLARSRRLRRRVRSHGLAVHGSWQAMVEARFEPTCLTVCLSNQCNLACTYCYSAPSDGARADRQSGDARFPLIAESTVRAAARLVARNCMRRGVPLTFALHGGGEPTLHWGLLQRVTAGIRRTGAEHSVGSRGYIATNGVMSEARALWLAENLEAIGVSCDGPPDIQNGQRPGLPGGTSKVVERSIRLLVGRCADLSVRVTITPLSVHRQSEIVEYLGERLGVRAIRLEPMYDGRRGSNGAFDPAQAEDFVRHFQAARRVARRIGCRVQLSGVRPGELHGPYCNVLRDVLQVMPDGTATACFLSTDARNPDETPLVIGRMDPGVGEFVLDEERIGALRRRAARIPRRCRECVNVYHCARDCPSTCLTLGEGDDAAPSGGFRCRVQKLIGESWILAGECPAYSV